MAAMPARFNFDRVADVYEETRRLPPVVLDGLAEQMASVFERGRVLDAGAGTGRYAEALAARDLAVVGLDLSRQMLDRARARGLGRLVQGEMIRLPFRDDAFDHAIAIHILHLLPDWWAMIDEVVRVTHGFLATTREMREPDIHRWYDEKIGLADRTSPGIEEEDLAARVAPAVRFPRIVWREAMAAEAYLDLLGSKTFTSQWQVSDEAHARAMADLRGELAGKTFDSKRTWELLVWRVEDLRAI